MVEMSRETLEEKAARYLGEGRVRVLAMTPDGVSAKVRGSGNAVYNTRRESRRWACDCPAWRRECCHVQALRLVT